MRTSRNFDRIYATKKRIVLNRWWTSSWKTYSIMQMFFKWLRTWEFRENEFFDVWVWTVVRQFRSQIESSVLRDFKNIVSDEWFLLSNRFSWGNVIKENKSTMTYTYWWRTLEFVGLDDPQKAKGPRRKLLYINEADSVQKKVAMQLVLRTQGPCLFDWNPDDDEVWLNTDLEQKRAAKIWDVELIISTFRDNPFLDDEIVREILALRELDPDEWEVYWNWWYWKIKGAIFKENIHWRTIKLIPKHAEFVWYGQDFWFSDDPTTLTAIYKFWNNSIVLDQVMYEHWLINTYQEESQKQLSITWHYEMHNVDTSDKIWADSSEPKSIEEISYAWYNIEWVVKGPGSVVSWIKFMKKYRIYVTDSSLEMKKEFKKYIWATDKNWKTLKDKANRPIAKKWNDHCIDWARYWMTHLLWWQDMSELDLSTW